MQKRCVCVFPDLSNNGNTFKEWEAKAKDYATKLNGTKFIFSDLLEQLAPERDKSEGNDIADYLIKQDWRLFRKNTIQEKPPQPKLEKVTEVTKVTHQQNILFQSETQPQQTIPTNEKQIIIKEVVSKNQNLSIDNLLQICINKCLFQSKSKAFNSVDYYLFNKELRLNNISNE